MGAERTVDTRWIAVEGELILSHLIRVRSATGIGRLLTRHEGIARPGAADHRRSKPLGFHRIDTGLTADELPEAPHVLPQMPHDEIGAVATEVLFLRRVLRWEQIRARGIGLDHRPIGILPVFVAIPEQKLTQRDYVAVPRRSPGPAAPITLLGPIDV